MGLSTIISQNYHSKLGQHKETKYMVLLNNLKEWMVLKNGSFLNQLDVSLNVYFAWTYSENFQNPKWSDERSETALEIKHLQNVLKLVYEYYELHNLDAKIFICLLWKINHPIPPFLHAHTILHIQIHHTRAIFTKHEK